MVRVRESASPGDTRPDGPGAARARPPAGTLVVAVPGLLAFCLGLWGAGALSFDRDEAITVSMARRSVPEILRVLPHFDVVHGLYYLTEHFVAAVFGTSEVALRMPSVIGTAVAAAGTAAIGRRLAGPLCGLLAGVVYAMLPIAGFYAHVARQYAIVPAAAAIVTLLFLRALERQSRRAYLAYAVGVALLGLLHLFALLLIAAHLLTLLASRPTRARLRAVVIACAAAVIVLTPLALVAETQRNLIAWATRPGLGTAASFLTDFTGGRPASLLVIVLMAAAWVPWFHGRTADDTPDKDRVGLRVLASFWFFTPPVLLLTISQVHPLYSPRYAMVGLPGAALLAAAGAVRIRWRVAGVVAVAVAVALMIPLNVRERRPSYAIDQFREAAQVVKAGKRPGDVLLFLPGGRSAIADAYPGSFTGVRDIAVDRSAAQAAALTGTEVNAAALRQRMVATAPRRVWLVAFSRYVLCGGTRNLSPMSQAKMDLLARSFQRQTCRQVHGMTVELYVRAG